jgi:diguanylate cyclase (GGDEF)-like protein
MHEHRALRILCVEDLLSTQPSLTPGLRHCGHAVTACETAEEALILLERERPDTVILDVRLPGHDGHWAAREMRKTEAGRWIPILFVSSQGTEDAVMQAIEAGADDVLVKPVSGRLLLAKLRTVERIRQMREHLIQISTALRVSNAQLENLALTDALTGLGNRRAFDDRLALEVARARREQTALTLMMIDVDHFKHYNDRHGHPAGDVCLQKVAGALRQTCRRPADLAVRYGGEEFALILPNTPCSGAMALARTLQAQVHGLAIAHPDSPADHFLSLSGGVTTCVPDARVDATSLILQADQALYLAKARGRARFFSHELQLDTAQDCAAPQHPTNGGAPLKRAARPLAAPAMPPAPRLAA